MLSLWIGRTQPSGAISVMKLSDVSQQLLANDRGPMHGLLYLVLSRKLGFPQGNGCIAPVRSARLPTHLRGGEWSTGRWYLEEERKRMRRDPEEFEGVTLPRVYDDPVLKRGPTIAPLFCAGCESRGMLSATLSPLKHADCVLCTNPAVDCV